MRACVAGHTACWAEVQVAAGRGVFGTPPLVGAAILTSLSLTPPPYTPASLSSPPPTSPTHTRPGRPRRPQVLRLAAGQGHLHGAHLPAGRAEDAARDHGVPGGVLPGTGARAAGRHAPAHAPACAPAAPQAHGAPSGRWLPAAPTSLPLPPPRCAESRPTCHSWRTCCGTPSSWRATPPPSSSRSTRTSCSRCVWGGGAGAGAEPRGLGRAALPALPALLACAACLAACPCCCSLQAHRSSPEAGFLLAGPLPQPPHTPLPLPNAAACAPAAAGRLERLPQRGQAAAVPGGHGCQRAQPPRRHRPAALQVHTRAGPHPGRPARHAADRCAPRPPALSACLSC
jgi:hypothetical protein